MASRTIGTYFVRTKLKFSVFKIIIFYLPGAGEAWSEGGGEDPTSWCTGDAKGDTRGERDMSSIFSGWVGDSGVEERRRFFSSHSPP